MPCTASLLWPAAVVYKIYNDGRAMPPTYGNTAPKSSVSSRDNDKFLDLIHLFIISKFPLIISMRGNLENPEVVKGKM